MSLATAHTLDDALGGELALITVDQARQRDDAVLGRDANLAGVNLRVPVELADDGVSEANV